MPLLSFMQCVTLVQDCLEELDNSPSAALMKQVHENTTSADLVSILKARVAAEPRLVDAGIQVHAEYNLHRVSQKRLEYRRCADQQAQTRSVRPDIIVHAPARDEHNLIVIEAKKHNSATGRREADRQKLISFTSPDQPYRYVCGVFLHYGKYAVITGLYSQACRIEDLEVLRALRRRRI